MSAMRNVAAGKRKVTMATAVRNAASNASARARPEDVGRHNRGLLLQMLFQERTMSRSALATATSLTKPAVSRIVDQLIEAGLVRELARNSEHRVRGRPHVGIELDPEGAYVLGVAIGAYEQSVRLVNLRGDCIARQSLELLRLPSPQNAIAAIATAARALVDASAIPVRRVLALSLAIAGVVDHEHGVVIDSPNIGWRDVDIGSALAQQLRMPVQIDALHHVLNIAEARVRRDRKVDEALLVNVALGIGSSALERGRIIRGGHAMAGQIGHMHVAGARELCTCGRHGCLDTVASGYAVLRRLGYIKPRIVSREHRPHDATLLLAAIERERQGDAQVRMAFRRSGNRLGTALCAVRSVLDPERIWLAGPVSQASSFVAGVRERLLADTGARAVDATPFIDLSSYAGDEAAALVALNHFAFGPGLDLARIAP